MTANPTIEPSLSGHQGPAPADLHVLAVSERVDLADDVIGIALRSVDGAPLPAWDAGSHIDLIFPVPGLGTLSRQYSLCGDPADAHEWRIAVLAADPGRGGSRHLHAHLDSGTVLQARGPRNAFPLAPAPEYLFLAGGIGITPIKAMVDRADHLEVPWTLHYAGRRRSRMAFLADLESAHPARVHAIAEDEHGLPDLGRILANVDARTSVYACGPAPMLDAVVAACSALGRPAPHLERFTASAHTDDLSSQPVEVEFRRLGVTRTVGAGESILDVAEELGSDIFGSCREGICGTCETRVLEGTPDHRDDVLSEDRRTDHMVICVSRSHSPRLVLDA